ncbi:hypothetical protein ABIA35_006014 [Catenulispora sp. MAP12-49]|uniref:hypothetical protein n=1 Tax=Catenulispora sp. MAP12-49 TaxID=3156302 RepID=UPI0035119C71
MTDPEQIAREALGRLGEPAGDNPTEQIHHLATTTSAQLQDVRARMVAGGWLPDPDEYVTLADRVLISLSADARIQRSREVATLEAWLTVSEGRDA